MRTTSRHAFLALLLCAGCGSSGTSGSGASGHDAGHEESGAVNEAPVLA